MVVVTSSLRPESEGCKVVVKVRVVAVVRIRVVVRVRVRVGVDAKCSGARCTLPPAAA